MTGRSSQASRDRILAFHRAFEGLPQEPKPPAPAVAATPAPDLRQISSENVKFPCSHCRASCHGSTKVITHQGKAIGCHPVLPSGMAAPAHFFAEPSCGDPALLPCQQHREGEKAIVIILSPAADGGAPETRRYFQSRLTPQK